MKTKTFLLLCLLLGMGVSQLSAQTRSEISYPFMEGPYCFNIECNGDWIELCSTNYIVKNIIHSKDGDFEWFRSNWRQMVFTNTNTGEIFIPHGGEKGGTKGPNDGFWEIKVNLTGSMGHAYLLHLSINFETGEWDVKSNCK